MRSAAFLALLCTAAPAEDCKAISDATARLACFDKPPPAAAKAPKGGLDFATIKRAMNAKYPTYFAHHQTSLIGSKTVGDRKIFYIKVPDPNPTLQITAACSTLDQGGWMCSLIPNYGNFGVLPLTIR